jgi:hypothetical protein
MRIHCEPNINDNKISTVITIVEFGNETLTPEEELAMLSNYPVTLEYKTLTFKKKLNFDAKGEVVEDATNGEELEVKLINKKIPVNKDFKAEFEIALKDIEVQINKLREDLQIEKDNNNASYLYGIFFGLSYAYNNLIKQ